VAEDETGADQVALTVQLLSAYLAKNAVAPEDLAGLIRSTRTALAADLAPPPAETAPPAHTPAVSVKKSLASPEHIISLIDGKPYKTLKRHLTSRGLTPEQYRERYSLPANYPMVAPSFAAMRRAVATRIGLGNLSATKAAVAVSAPAETAVDSAPVSSKLEVTTTVAPKKGRARSKPAAAGAAAKVAARKSKPAAPKGQPKAQATAADAVLPEAGLDVSQPADAIAAPAAIVADAHDAAEVASTTVSPAETEKRPTRKPKSTATPKAAVAKTAGTPRTATVAADGKTEEKAARKRGKLGLFRTTEVAREAGSQLEVPSSAPDDTSQDEAGTPALATSSKPKKRPRMARAPKPVVE